MAEVKWKYKKHQRNEIEIENDEMKSINQEASREEGKYQRNGGFM